MHLSDVAQIADGAAVLTAAIINLVTVLIGRRRRYGPDDPDV
jgi:hypothetical protein